MVYHGLYLLNPLIPPCPWQVGFPPWSCSPPLKRSRRWDLNVYNILNPSILKCKTMSIHVIICDNGWELIVITCNCEFPSRFFWKILRLERYCQRVCPEYCHLGFMHQIIQATDDLGPKRPWNIHCVAIWFKKMAILRSPRHCTRHKRSRPQAMTLQEMMSSYHWEKTESTGRSKKNLSLWGRHPPHTGALQLCRTFGTLLSQCSKVLCQALPTIQELPLPTTAISMARVKNLTS
jgi:hypothetical protein